MPNKKLIGLTGPSAFSQQCMDTVEEFLDANFVLLYHGSDENTNFWLERVDGVILSGGVDIHPAVYRESVWANQNLSKFDIKRDFRELQIAEYCITNKKPMLGICRGHQLLGVRCGMGFMMDISSSAISHNPMRQQIQLDSKEPAHSVKIVNRDVVYGKYGMPKKAPERRVLRDVLADPDVDSIWVNSFHHQALTYNPKHSYERNEVTILGTSKVEITGCKEIVELMEGETWLSCQWHPEYDWKDNTPSRVILERFKKMINQGNS